MADENKELWVDPKTGIPEGNDIADPAKGKDVDWVKWLLAGGAGYLGHQLTSSVLDDVAEEKKKKSVWMRLLSDLAPIGVGGLSAYGAYLLGSKLGNGVTKKAQDATNSVPGKASSPKGSDSHKGMVNINDTSHDDIPFSRALWSLGLGGVSGSAGKDAWKSIWKNIDAPKMVAPGPEIVAGAQANIEALKRKMTVARTKKEIAEIERQLAEQQVLKATPVPNPGARGWRRWVRPAVGGAVSVGTALGAYNLASSIPDYLAERSKIMDARDKYEAWKALQESQGK